MEYNYLGTILQLLCDYITTRVQWYCNKHFTSKSQELLASYTEGIEQLLYNSLKTRIQLLRD
jgi:hypothetical protein